MSDAYYARVSSTGALLYATYLGGTGTDVGSGIALGPGGIGLHLRVHQFRPSHRTVTGHGQRVRPGHGRRQRCVRRQVHGGGCPRLLHLPRRQSAARPASTTAPSPSTLPASSTWPPTAAVGTTSSPRQRIRRDAWATRRRKRFFVEARHHRLSAPRRLRYSTYITGTNGQLWAYGVARDRHRPRLHRRANEHVERASSQERPAAHLRRRQPRRVPDQGGHEPDRRQLAALRHLPRRRSVRRSPTTSPSTPSGRAVVAGTTNSTVPQVVAKFPLVQQVASCPTFVRLTPFVTVIAAGWHRRRFLHVLRLELVPSMASPSARPARSGRSEAPTTSPPTRRPPRACRSSIRSRPPTAVASLAPAATRTRSSSGSRRRPTW